MNASLTSSCSPLNSTNRSWRRLPGAFLLLCLGLWAVPERVNAASPSDAFAQNRKIGRSVNVLGYDPIWRSFDTARFQTRHFLRIKQAGFDSIRVNLHPFRHMGAAPDFELSPAWWKTADWIVTNAAAARLTVILDCHEFNAMGEHFVVNRPRILAFWKQMSARWADAPPDVMFEILNEPNKQLTPALWNEVLSESLALIRARNPNRTVIVGPAFWNSVDHLDELKLPEADRNLIVTVHYYKPMEFTHQGASWSTHKDKMGVTWSGTAEEQSAVRRDFEKVQAWSATQRRPILLGEFGAYDKAEMPSRVRYTDFIARTAEGMGWSWAYWQFDSDFIVFDIAKDHWVEPILKALVPTGAGQPAN